jgi:uncharacterized protein
LLYFITDYNNLMMTSLFQKSKPLIGALQLLPLPGSPNWGGRFDQVLARAEQEATALATGGVDAIIVENTYDAPYSTGRIDSAGAIAMGLIIRRLMHFVSIPIGVSVLRNDPLTAIAIALNVNAQFVRVGLYTGAALTESGILQATYREIQSYKQQLLINRPLPILADISVDTSLHVGSDTGLIEHKLQQLAKQAVKEGKADGIILTDKDLLPSQVQHLKNTMDVPVWLDYKKSFSEATDYLQVCDGLIVSRTIQKQSLTEERPMVDLAKIEELAAMADMLRTPILNC